MNRQQRERLQHALFTGLCTAAMLGTSLTPLTAYADEAKQDQPQGTVIGNYAVQLYGIGQDTMADDTKGGLTFGPALGGDYLNVTIGHEPSGKTPTGNAHRCINKDTWAQIVDYSYDDPYIYEDCIEKGCVALVAITATEENSYAGSSDAYVLDSKMGMPMEGGASALYWELQDEARQYAAVKVDDDNKMESYSGLNWATSQIRAMLNGAQAETGAYGGSGYSYDSDTRKGNSLLAAFPIELQEAIGYRQTSYASSYEDTSSVDTCSDQLWLLSNMELFGNDVDGLSDYMKGKAAYLQEGAQYTRNVPIISLLGDGNDLAVAYRSDASGEGIMTSWWTRSRFQSSSTDRYASFVASSGLLGATDATYSDYSVAPAFTLNTDPKGPNLRDDNPEEPSEPSDPEQPSQPENPGSGDTGSGDAGSGDSGSSDAGNSATGGDSSGSSGNASSAGASTTAGTASTVATTAATVAATDAAVTTDVTTATADAAATEATAGVDTSSMDAAADRDAEEAARQALGADNGAATSNNPIAATGDASDMMLYAGIAAVAAIVLAGWGVRRYCTH